MTGKKIKEEDIKKLILVGNGFDLALGVATRYSEFVLKLFKDAVNEISGKHYPIKYKSTYVPGWETRNNDFFQFRIKNEIDTYKKMANNCNKIADFKTLNEQKYIETDFFDGDCSILKIIYENSYKLDNWVDLENTYYQLFIDILDGRRLGNNKFITREMRIEKLNEELDFIENQLEIYLSKLKLKKNDQHVADIKSHFYSEVDPDMGKVVNNENSVYFVNFNYTPFLSQIVPEEKVISIHGAINDDQIIFGYGDEMDEKYKEIEGYNDNEFLRKFKSFGYFQAPNYRKLLNIVNSGPFDVVIYGHSCGLSDRVLLNEIFEHKNCRYIRVYYYNDKVDYVDKTMNISRHFKSNQLMRQRVIDFQEGDRIPQRSDYE